jgi:uncharacterized protein (TIGR02266 family)
LPVTVRWGSHIERLHTEDVSFRGFFARTDTPPVLRQLVRVEAKLPPEDTPFTTTAMAVHAIELVNGLGRIPGVGFQFYAMGSERGKWEKFVQHLAKIPSLPVPAVEAPVAEPVRRRFPRVKVTLEVRPRTVEELVSLFTRDISRGGMFLLTDKEMPIGLELCLDLIHPTEQKSFPLAAMVRRRELGPPPGIGVEFVGMDPEQHQELNEFIYNSLAEPEIEVASENDPNLE